ncbi:Kiwa anti-phage protein KwaB-like domain-containing protein [Brevundimonas nasdae]|uniref:Kiwa anti-phage protein KwaB-like domain-containing protein n=1 Tax=Brevundimonas nasdae TaxID=172043 RepID=UPI000A031BD2|nr:Kiwa anti-phage protein KwaB-like domain-containing protein [Brevundimonas nasdae]
MMVNFPSFEADLAEASALLPVNVNVAVCIAVRLPNAPVPDLYRLQITDVLARKFAQSAIDTARELITDIRSGDRTLESYDASTVTDKHEVEIHEYQPGSVQEQIGSALSAAAQIQVFPGPGRGRNNLQFYSVTLSRKSDGKSYHFFRRYSKAKQLSRSGKIYTLFQAGTFDVIEEPLFVFDNYFDSLMLGGKAALVQKDNYHALFNFFDELRASAAQTIKTIQDLVPMQNGQAFTDDAKSNPLILMKLRGIAGRPYVPNLTVDQLEAKIIALGLPLQVVSVSGVKTIVYDPQHKWKLIRLLDDAFLSSDMTGTNYEAIGKRAI